MLNSHLIGFLALAKERARLLPFGWHPGTQLLGAYLNSYNKTSILPDLTYLTEVALEMIIRNRNA
ncbi:MAG: hypothetical protein KZQ66_02345 [Candidatus Thiodiazotropha sp. (ex Lucinoma aequizonata)]|nr:hypothetical protein [Candidatus Thiodiazotropha sp. (ex Lucinoma aequizonata)]MCU7895309.1 hypothetical protein [Candidatus Thiodiazotropha sp. (ex Lucinoma aequizonata)]MCU7898487.1 hypothetical protein [Candidatus Thiodiazotropha sp. (ex Lucinoma aequizonata)]MCU7900988.1 hypothetical protein [Candidatus Thiodiazotropha sp. (ex Lucinoma aequizonata)]MCU7910064.1 hypothetical protein [Candidatus Thiodiazotropha sp. (ex Lucinoma aequizonata)]